MTEAQRTDIPSPAIGLLVYQTDGSSGFWYLEVRVVQLSSGNYINNATVMQSANFYISGFGYAGNFLQSPMYGGDYKHTSGSARIYTVMIMPNQVSR